MKTKYLISVIIIFLSFLGCSDNSNIDLESDKFITHTVEGIEFKFCLLNKDSVPTTTFREGELFNFRLEVKNTSSEKKKILDLLSGIPFMYDKGKVHFYQLGVLTIDCMPHEIDIFFGETVVHYATCNLITNGELDSTPIPVGNYTFEFQIDLAFILEEGTLDFILPISIQ
jgi:hypothetical protein